MPTPREHPRSAVKRQSYGIFKDATVVEVDPEKDGNLIYIMKMILPIYRFSRHLIVLL